MSVLTLLHQAIASVCPIDGVSAGDWSDKATWRIEFAQTATQAQRDAAAVVVAGFDVLAAEASLAEDATRVIGIRADAERAELLNRLKTATPAQIRTYVNNNVTDLASAKLMMARILVLIALDAR